MLYWTSIFFLVALGYFITDAYLSFRNNKIVTVKFKNKDGTVEEGEITLGRDPEVDKLIAKLRAEKKAKHS